MLESTARGLPKLDHLPIPVYFRHLACVVALSLSDAAAFALAALVFRSWYPEPKVFLGSDMHGTQRIELDVFLVLANAFVFANALIGNYSRRKPFWDDARDAFTALFVTCLPDLVLTVFRPHYFAWGVAGSWVFLFFAIPSFRQVTRTLLQRSGVWQTRTALIGTGPVAEVAYRALHDSVSMGFDIRWLISLDAAAGIPESLASLKRYTAHSPEEVAQLVRAMNCNEAVIALDEYPNLQATDIAQRLNEIDIETAIVPSMGRLPMGNLEASVLFGRNLVLFQTRNNLKRWPQRLLKRVFDILGAFFGLILISPLFLIVAILIKARDRGPVFYIHRRVGRNGQPFPCLKFRTMAVDAAERLARWRDENPELYEEFRRTYKLKNDPRVTPLGDWLRRTSIDELPQLINVLRGEMSFVGPRPVVERELIEFYGPAAELYMRVRPGLTGLWQISGRSDTTYEARVAYDEWYILNWSFWYDLVIIAQTFRAVTTGHGAM